METWNWRVPNPCVVDIKWWDILGARDSNPTPNHPAQGSNARNISLHNFWLQNQWGLGQWKKWQNSQASPIKGLTVHMDLLRLTPSGLQNQGSSLMGTTGIQGGTEVSGKRARAEGQLPPRENCRQQSLYLFRALSHIQPQCGSTISESPSTWLTR